MGCENLSSKKGASILTYPYISDKVGVTVSHPHTYPKFFLVAICRNNIHNGEIFMGRRLGDKAVKRNYLWICRAGIKLVRFRHGPFCHQVWKQTPGLSTSQRPPLSGKVLSITWRIQVFCCLLSLLGSMNHKIIEKKSGCKGALKVSKPGQLLS